MPDAVGPIILKSNGISTLGFDLGLKMYYVENGGLKTSINLGTWSANRSGELVLSPNAKKNMEKLRIVTVVQPPFMMWNETSGTNNQTTGRNYDF